MHAERIALSAANSGTSLKYGSTSGRKASYGTVLISLSPVCEYACRRSRNAPPILKPTRVQSSLDTLQGLCAYACYTPAEIALPSDNSICCSLYRSHADQASRRVVAHPCLLGSSRTLPTSDRTKSRDHLNRDTSSDADYRSASSWTATSDMLVSLHLYTCAHVESFRGCLLARVKRCELLVRVRVNVTRLGAGDEQRERLQEQLR